MGDPTDVGDDAPPSCEPVTLEGKFVFPSGAVYEGEYVESDGVKKRHGCGEHVNGKEKYVGGWHEDAMHGEGVFTFPSGAMYEGTFVRNKFHGVGRYTWSDGATYDGGWRENMMHGRGCYTDRDKARWEGDFFNGMYDNGKARVSLR